MFVWTRGTRGAIAGHTHTKGHQVAISSLPFLPLIFDPQKPYPQ